MNTLELFKEQFTYRPVRVEFAGLYGDTVSMAKSGWELNLQIERSHASPSYIVFFTGVNRPLNLRIISARLQLTHHAFCESMQRSLSYLDGICTRIDYCATNIVVNLVGDTNELSVANWSGEVGIYTDLGFSKQKNFDDLFHFPSLDKTVFIPESKIWTIEEHLDAIRKAQEPFQDQLLREDRFKEKQQTKLKLIGVS